MYVIPDTKKSIAQNKFEFKIGTKTYWIPKIKFLSGRDALLLSELTIDDVSSVAKLFDALAPDDRTKEALLELPVEVLEGLMLAWQEDSGVSLGESDSSAG